MHRTFTFLTILCSLLVAERATAEQKTPREPEKIAWFGTLESARKEAARTNRPIFLLAARPCAGSVPGFW
ncbi:MAG: hypothetical protein AAF517_08020 [Planctomycetota bacterium]